MFRKNFFDLVFFFHLVTSYPIFFLFFVDRGQDVYVPYFFLAYPLAIVIKDLAVYYNKRNKILDPVFERIILLSALLVAFYYIAICSFQASELFFADTKYSMFDSLYFVTITITTVGYGDISPTSATSKAVVLLFIALALSIVPGLISSLLELNEMRASKIYLFKWAENVIFLEGCHLWLFLENFMTVCFFWTLCRNLFTK